MLLNLIVFTIALRLCTLFCASLLREVFTCYLLLGCRRFDLVRFLLSDIERVTDTYEP
jgi:hypothetical protein